jgi:uncharacterized protein YsxB (DUF464 family)
MITIKITDRSIRMNGHACRKSPDGIDRVCTAVSALTCNLINSLEDLSDGGKLLIDSWFLGLQCLARNTIAYSLSK